MAEPPFIPPCQGGERGRSKRYAWAETALTNSLDGYLANGESLHYAKEQMGHASIRTTLDVYGHLVPGSNRNAVNRLDGPAGA